MLASIDYSYITKQWQICTSSEANVSDACMHQTNCYYATQVLVHF